jgi:peptide/nickel transport system substrate-binding protein
MRLVQQFGVGLCLVLAGCSNASAPSGTSAKSDQSGSVKSGASATAPADEAKPSESSSGSGNSSVDQLVASIKVMTEIDGIEIPRLAASIESRDQQAPIPADVGNPKAAAKPTKPVTGDSIRIRFNSEPKVLNPVTETSAVQTYIGQYVQEALARQNPETFEYEPNIAKGWKVEDSIKLSPSYPGKERRLKPETGDAATELVISFDAGTKETPNKLKLTVVDGAGQSVGKSWVGAFPTEPISGAPTNGYHLWTDLAGVVEISGIPSGKYRLTTGVELYGQATKEADGSLRVVPLTDENPLKDQLAKSAETSLVIAPKEWIDVQQGTYYTYYLRDDVKWSDGTPYTTKDIELAYAVLNNPTVDGDSIRTYYQDLVECDVIAPSVVRMRYRQQYFKAFEFTAGISAFGPPWHLFSQYLKEEGKELTLERLSEREEEAQKKVSAHGEAFGKFFNTDLRYNLQPLGTGPYIVGEWQRNDRLTLERNKNYWNSTKAGHLDKLIFRFIPDNVSAFQALRAGQLDFCPNLTPEQFHEDYARLPNEFKANHVQSSWFTPMFNYFGWNLTNPKFQDRRVRVALALLFDKESFLKQKLYNEGAVVSGSQYVFGKAYDHSVAPIGYSPDVARELLSDAGWIDSDNDGLLDKGGEKFEISIQLPPGNPVAIERVELFQKSLKTVGIDLQVRTLEWASFIENVRSKQFDIVTLSWASTVEADPFQIWHSSGAKPEARGSNAISFANENADLLIEQIRLTLDEPNRLELHRAFHRLLDAEQPYMFLYCVKDFGIYNQKYRGVKWYKLRPGYDLTEWYVGKDE